jgi:hypothetical protein
MPLTITHSKVSAKSDTADSSIIQPTDWNSNHSITGSAITAATAVTASNVAVDFNSIPSWVRRIVITYTNISTNGTSVIHARVGTSSGYVASGYTATLIGITGAGGVSYYSSSVGFPIPGGNPASSASGAITLSKITGNVWVCSATQVETNFPSAGMTSGHIDAGGTLDRIRLTTANGTDTFDAGTINIMWE